MYSHLVPPLMLRHGMATGGTHDNLHRFLEERIRQAAMDSSSPHARDFCACAIADRLTRGLHGRRVSTTTTDHSHFPDPFVCAQHGRLDFLVATAVKKLAMCESNTVGFDLNQPSTWEESLGRDIDSTAAAVVDHSVNELQDVALRMLSRRAASNVPLDLGRFGCVVGRLVVALGDLFERVVTEDDDDDRAGRPKSGRQCHRLRSDQETRSLLQILLEFDPSLATWQCQSSPLTILARLGKELSCRCLIGAGCPLLSPAEHLSVACDASVADTTMTQRLKRVVSGPPLPPIPEYEASVCFHLGDIAGLVAGLQITCAYISDVAAGSEVLHSRFQRDADHATFGLGHPSTW